MEVYSVEVRATMKLTREVMGVNRTTAVWKANKMLERFVKTADQSQMDGWTMEVQRVEPTKAEIVHKLRWPDHGNS